MLPEIDIWRAASVMLKRYRDTAWFEAARRTDGMLDAGDIEGAAVWRRVLKVIEKLQTSTPADGERVH